MNDEAFRKILSFFDLSWSGYRRVRKGVKKRIVRHMISLNLTCANDFLRVLAENGQEREGVRELLTVTISRFFRDRQLWDVLRSIVFPDLMRLSSNGIKIWCAGCACGEEVYSLRILWDEMTESALSRPALEVWATDINPDALRRALMGEYHASSLKEVSSERKQKYFVQASNRYTVSERLRHGIHWENRDIVSEEPPGGSFHLVFLRNNLLTYYDDRVKAAACLKVIEAIRSGGYLVVGNNERIPFTEASMEQCPDYRGVWKKTKATHALPNGDPLRPAHATGSS